MSEHSYVIVDATGANFRTDINSVLRAIYSNNSGSSEPSTTYAYQWFYNTSDHTLKIRNSANDGWIIVADFVNSASAPRFQGNAGSLARPTYAFTGDTDTGIYRTGANAIAIVTGGTAGISVDSSQNVEIAGSLSVSGAQGITGEIRMWSGSSAPTGWLLCNGESKSRTTYSDLFGIIGVNYGSADGSHFNVPDMRGRVPCGVGTGAGDGSEDADGGTAPSGTALTARSLGEWTGSETIAEANLPAHTHGPGTLATGNQSASHGHPYTNPAIGTYGGLDYDGSGTAVEYPTVNGGTTGDQDASHTHTVTTGVSASTGSGTDYMQPIMCVNFIIKT